jgi:cytosine/adenosine deaminase-related metal-dependent hydrolase
MPETNIYTASWLYNPGHPPIPGGGIAVKNGVILQAGSAKELAEAFGKPATEYPGCVIMPGFVNAHTHLELTHFPSWRLRGGLDYHPHRFVDWIIQMIKIRRGLSHEETLSSLKAGIASSLRAGTTAVGDILTSPSLLPAYKNTAIRGRFYLELIGQSNSLFEQVLSKAVDATKITTGNLYPGLSPHSPYTINSTLLPDIANAAKTSNLPLSLHLAESPDESELLFSSTGPLAEELYPLVGWHTHLPEPRHTTPAAFFDKGGLLGSETLAVHCVQVTPNDAAILQERGVTICLCPRSNERLAVGTAPVHLFKKLGIPLCLGTDSLASNDSLSLWDEIRFALDIYKGSLSPEELLLMATIGGASGIGVEKTTGSLDSGKRADFQVVELQGNCTAENLLLHGRTKEVVAGGETWRNTLDND